MISIYDGTERHKFIPSYLVKSTYISPSLTLFKEFFQNKLILSLSKGALKLFFLKSEFLYKE